MNLPAHPHGSHVCVWLAFQTSVSIEIRYQAMDGTVGTWSDGEFLESRSESEGRYALETDSLISSHRHGTSGPPSKSAERSFRR